MNILIQNGKRLTADLSWQENRCIFIADGRIVALDQAADDFKADKVVDATGSLIMPGLIDLNASLREPGFHMKGSIASETAAAAAGGVTTVCCSADTRPVNDSKAVSKLIEELAEESGKCRVYPLGALTQGLEGERLAQYASLKAAGCIALSNGFRPIKNLEITKRCFEYAKSHDLSVFINAIEPSLHNGAMHEGVTSTTIGLRGIPSIAETIPVAQLIQIAEVTGVHLHLAQLSTAGSVELVKQAKSKGVNITADVAIQNLLFTDDDIVDFNGMYQCLPPLRSEQDRQALIAGIKEGVIDAISSNHQPHEPAAKLMPFAEAEPGMSSIELLLPIANKLADSDGLPMTRFIEAMTHGPAKVLGLSQPNIEEGLVADVCIFRAETTWTLSPDQLTSLGKNTPLIGQALSGKVQTTILDGMITHSLV